MTWIWCEWESLEDFDLWHTEIKKTLGYPKPGINQESKELDEDAQWAMDYTEPISVENKIIAVVESEHLKNLVPTDLRPPRRDYGDES